jgi:hypothetical protein
MLKYWLIAVIQFFIGSMSYGQSITGFGMGQVCLESNRLIKLWQQIHLCTNPVMQSHFYGRNPLFPLL